MLVVAFHAGLGVPGGFTGVDVFFVISGFVITRSLLDELAASGSLSLLGFYGRRVKRLLPGLALMLIAVTLVGTLADAAATQRMSAITAGFASLFAANIYLGALPTGYFDISMNLNPLLHTWTLAVEEQFYLVFPVLLLCCWRFGRNRTVEAKRLIAASVISVLAVASFIYSTHLSLVAISTAQGAPARLAFYSAPTRAWEFAAGALLFLASPALVRLPRAMARILGVAGLAAILGAAFATSAGSFPSLAALVPVAATCALLAAGTASRTGTARLLSSRPACWVGDRSYGWYLWHWPLIVFATVLWPASRLAAPIAASLALLPTAFSYRFVENPIRFHRALRGRTLLALALACLVVPIGAAAGALTISHRLAHLPSMTRWTNSFALHADVSRNCDNNPSVHSSKPAKCTWHAPGAHGQIVLFGDSQAGQLTEPVVRAGNRAGYDVTVTTFSACPYVGLPIHPYCQQFSDKTVAALVRSPPKLVILAARTDRYLNHAPVRDLRGWKRRLHAVLTRLNEAGIPVVLVHPVPRLPIAPSRCAVVTVLTNRCATSRPRSEAEHELRFAVAVEQAGAAKLPLTSSISLDDDLCSRTRCSTMRHGIYLYREDEHLSVQGAITLTRRFQKLIAANAR